MNYEISESDPLIVEEVSDFDLRNRTKQYDLRIIKLYSALPKTTEAQVIGKQLLRSGTSAGANYREAYRARSRAEFTAKAGISIQELDETSYWLEILVEAEIYPQNRLSNLIEETNELLAIFTSIVKKTKA